jgi:integral membrane sensor domain MASE1
MTWLAIPLAAVVSLVWNATRFEETRCILVRSTRMFLTLTIFMALIGGALYLLSYNL